MIGAFPPCRRLGGMCKRVLDWCFVFDTMLRALHVKTIAEDGSICALPKGFTSASSPQVQTFYILRFEGAGLFFIECLNGASDFSEALMKKSFKEFDFLRADERLEQSDEKGKLGKVQSASFIDGTAM